MAIQLTNILHNRSTVHIFTRYCNRIVNFDSDKVRKCHMVAVFTLIRCDNMIRDKVVGCVIEGGGCGVGVDVGGRVLEG